ncbi:DUF5658 family protein [Caldibacillus lycopersici]|uniref:DUF5658 family protein n=1 Tax=Perspicuibacillus lycopersici TaxID=1325689 RepID=A0AAE3LMC2_9BACI|nr:DUF5658 family protein [Perspicuibacillus lycopersici]MCU9612791.1 DUF5658 family protein [Perspicuibacillus lycopersici]
MIKLFHYLAIVNLLDGVITYFGLKNGYIKEANPIMAFLYQVHPSVFISMKLILSVLIYTMILIHHIPVSKISFTVSTIVSIMYTVILFLHSVWLSNFITNY